jgi:hypothetical protein
MSKTFTVLADSWLLEDPPIMVGRKIKEIFAEKKLECYNFMGYSFSVGKLVPAMPILDIKNLGRKIVDLYTFYTYSGEKCQVTLPTESKVIFVYAPLFIDNIYYQPIIKKEESFSEILEITFPDPPEGRAQLDGIFSNEGLIVHDKYFYDKVSVWQKV